MDEEPSSVAHAGTALLFFLAVLAMPRPAHATAGFAESRVEYELTETTLLLRAHGDECTGFPGKNCLCIERRPELPRRWFGCWAQVSSPAGGWVLARDVNDELVLLDTEAADDDDAQQRLPDVEQRFREKSGSAPRFFDANQEITGLPLTERSKRATAKITTAFYLFAGCVPWCAGIVLVARRIFPKRSGLHVLAFLFAATTFIASAWVLRTFLLR